MELHSLVGVGGVYYGGRHDSTAALSSLTTATRDLVNAGQARDWFRHVEHLAGGQPEITVIVDDVPGRGPFDPASAMRQLALWIGGMDGWITPDVERSIQTGWSSWVRTNTRHPLQIHLGVIPLLDPSRTPLFRLTDAAQRIAMNLTAYRAATGSPWRATAGVSGCSTIRRIAADSAAIRVQTATRRGNPVRLSEPRWRWDDQPSILSAAGDLRYARRMAPAERHGFVHQLDVRAQYLAAAGVVGVGYGIPRRVDTVQFDPAVAGYWDVRGDVLPNAMRPWAVDTRRGVMDSVVLTTPVMAYLLDHGISPEVIQAWVPATSSRILRPWVERLVDGKSAVLGSAHPDVVKAWKRTYTETIGMMAAEGGSICRADWRDMIIDMARVNLLRKLDRVHKLTGSWPIKIYVDSIWIYSEDEYPAPEVMRALGAIDSDGQPTEGIGKFRMIKTTPADAFAADHEAKMGQR